MCNKCIKGLNISTQTREDLEETVSIYEDPDYNDWGHLVNTEDMFNTIEDEE